MSNKCSFDYVDLSSVLAYIDKSCCFVHVSTVAEDRFKIKPF